MTRHAVFVLPALFCIALGVFIGYLLWYQPDEEPEESNVVDLPVGGYASSGRTASQLKPPPVDLPVGVRDHPRLVRSEEG